MVARVALIVTLFQVTDAKLVIFLLTCQTVPKFAVMATTTLKELLATMETSEMEMVAQRLAQLKLVMLAISPPTRLLIPATKSVVMVLTMESTNAKTEIPTNGMAVPQVAQSSMVGTAMVELRQAPTLAMSCVEMAETTGPLELAKEA